MPRDAIHRDTIHVAPVGPNGPIPTLLFEPDSGAGPWPLVLLGHGAHLSKDDPTMQLIARGFTSIPAVVAVMDAPDHGERRSPELGDDDWHDHVLAQVGDPRVHEQLMAEWPLVIDAARAAVPGATGRVAYAGFSMGTIFGLSIVGSLPEASVAFFAVGGYVSDDRPNATAVNAMIQQGISRLGDRAVLMCNMTRDESFPIARAIEALEAIPGPKHMGVWAGGHAELPPESFTMAIRFLRRHLAAG